MTITTKVKRVKRTKNEPPADKLPMIVADWRTGEFTIRQLAIKHGVSSSFVGEHTKNIDKDTASLVDRIVETKQELALLDGHAMAAVDKIVEERTKHIQFFNDAAIKNVKSAVSKIGEETTQMEHRMLADTILKGKETVLGKAPDTQVNVQNNVFTKIERVIVSA